MQLTINSFTQLFPDTVFSLIFNKIPDIFLIVVKFPDISRLSSQVVTLYRYVVPTVPTAKQVHKTALLQHLLQTYCQPVMSIIFLFNPIKLYPAKLLITSCA